MCTICIPRCARATCRPVTLALALAVATTIALLATSSACADTSGRLRDSSPRALDLAAVGNEGSASLESAASKAGETGRKIAMSLIALGFSIASIVLAFRRDFREAAGIFAIGIVAILLATPAGENVLHETVNSLFGAS